MLDAFAAFKQSHAISAHGDQEILAIQPFKKRLTRTDDRILADHRQTCPLTGLLGIRGEKVNPVVQVVIDGLGVNKDFWPFIAFIQHRHETSHESFRNESLAVVRKNDDREVFHHRLQIVEEFIEFLCLQGHWQLMVNPDHLLVICNYSGLFGSRPSRVPNEHCGQLCLFAQPVEDNTVFVCPDSGNK